MMERHRGQRRFWVTLDNRYHDYYWPATMVVKCPRCRARAVFSPSIQRPWERQADGSIELARLPLGGIKDGAGSCTACGHAFGRIGWPQDAYYCASVGGGEFWAWNESFLELLRARVSGDRVRERQLCLRDHRYHYFLTRLPRHVVVTRNRVPILRKIDRWLKAGQ